RGAPGIADAEADEHHAHAGPQRAAFHPPTQRDRDRRRAGVAAVRHVDHEPLGRNAQLSLEVGEDERAVSWCGTKRSTASTARPFAESTRLMIAGTSRSVNAKISAPFMYTLFAVRSFPPSSICTGAFGSYAWRMPPAGTMRFGAPRPSVP